MPFFKSFMQWMHPKPSQAVGLCARLHDYQNLLNHSYNHPSSVRAAKRAELAGAALAPCLPTEEQPLLKHPTTLKDLVDRFVAAEPENLKLLQALESYQQEFMQWQKNIYDLKAVNRLSKIKNIIYRDLAPHEHAMLNDKEGIATLIDAHRHNTRDRLIPKPPEVNVTRASKPEPVNNLPQQLRDYQMEQQALETTATSVEQAAAALPKPLLKELGIDAARIPQDVQGIEALIGKLQQQPEHKAALKPVIEKLGTLRDSHERMSNLLEVLVPQLEAKKIHPDALADANKLQVLLNSHPLQTQLATAAIPAVEINAAIQPLEVPKIPEAATAKKVKPSAKISLTYTSEAEHAAIKATKNIAQPTERPPFLKRLMTWMGAAGASVLGGDSSHNPRDQQLTPPAATASFDPSAPAATPVKIEILPAEERKRGTTPPTASVSPAPKEPPPLPRRKKAPLQALPTSPESPLSSLAHSQPLVSEPPAAIKAAESAAKKSGGKAKWIFGGIGVAAVAIGAMMAMSSKGEAKDNGQGASR